MPVYMVERILPGATLETVETIGRAADEMSRTFAAQGRPVRYMRSTFIPGESRCQSLFEAPNADLVQEVNDTAQIPYSRIVIAVDLPAEGSSVNRHSCRPHSHH